MKAPDNQEQEMSFAVLSNLSTAILLVDETLHIIYANHAAENLLQASASQLSERCITQIAHDADVLVATLNNAHAQNQAYTQRQFQICLPGKDQVTADMTVTPFGDAGQILIELNPMDRYLRIDRDAAIKEHHEATRQMVRGLAHEIKNPLGGIKGSAQLLARELTTGDYDEYTNIIIDEVDRLTSLVDRMLGPNVLPVKQPQNIHETLERTARLIELEASDALLVIRDYDPSIPELMVDSEMLSQAILNVVRNAWQSCQSTPHPLITLQTRIERQLTITGTLHKIALSIAVTDNGPGIPDEIRDHLFYPMVSGRPEGTGLGLPFAHSIVSRHQGMIEFSSGPGDTTFRIYLPLDTIDSTGGPHEQC